MHDCLSAQAEMLTGSAVANVEEARGAARELLRRGCRSAIVTLGPQGCVVLQAQGSTAEHVPAAAAVTAVDTTVSTLEKGNGSMVTEKEKKTFVKRLFSAEIDFSRRPSFPPLM